MRCLQSVGISLWADVFLATHTSECTQSIRQNQSKWKVAFIELKQIDVKSLSDL